MEKVKNPPEGNGASNSAAKGKKSPAGKAAAKTPSKAVAAAAKSGDAESTPVNPQPSQGELQDEIRQRAYQIYCERGGGHGLHHADWHRAELEVRAKYEKNGT